MHKSFTLQILVLLVFMHMVTELHLSKYPCSDIEADVAADIDVLVEVCQKLSRCMMHLLLTLPSLLLSAVATLNNWQADMSENDIMTELKKLDPQTPAGQGSTGGDEGCMGAAHHLHCCQVMAGDACSTAGKRRSPLLLFGCSCDAL